MVIVPVLRGALVIAGRRAGARLAVAGCIGSPVIICIAVPVLRIYRLRGPGGPDCSIVALCVTVGIGPDLPLSSGVRTVSYLPLVCIGHACAAACGRCIFYRSSGTASVPGIVSSGSLGITCGCTG